jgi:ABC-type multidrug transport system fused ATPase/permease subunit
LRDVSFSVKSGDKIGIVGRTGSGKSSITMSLFRVAELSAGVIYIDDVDISTVPLKLLRSSIEIIPQNPVLFKGDLRSCLDPLQQYSDNEIWIAIKKSQLNLILSVRDSSDNYNKGSDLLRLDIAENGNNLSVGERQMIVLTRAILRGAKVSFQVQVMLEFDKSV